MNSRSKVSVSVPKLYCKAFEDNLGAYELARVPKMRPRTKHINQKYHHFRSYLADKKIQVFQIPTEEQLADVFTKPLPYDLFQKFVQRLFGWSIPNAFASLGYQLKESHDVLRECENNQDVRTDRQGNKTHVTSEWKPD